MKTIEVNRKGCSLQTDEPLWNPKGTLAKYMETHLYLKDKPFQHVKKSGEIVRGIHR